MSTLVEDTAHALGLRIVRPLAGGLFGATLVRDDADAELVLKVMPDPELASTWATGAAVAERLRARGYPASRYRGTGCTETAVWSLQEPMSGSVPERMDVNLAHQLVALVRGHAVDSGFKRQWRDDAIDAARRWLAAAVDAGTPAEHASLLSDSLERGASADIARTSIVHGDFHVRNCLVNEGSICGVFDWEVAGPGDWRFDLVTLAFWSLVYPRDHDDDASSVVVAAVREECPDDVLVLMVACQTLRIVAIEAARHPDRTDTAGRLIARVEPLLVRVP